MNAETQRLALVRVRVALETHFAKVRFAHAATLARAGRLLEAEALLRSRDAWRDNPSELDLLARLAAKRRDLSQAKRLWQDALSLDPGNSAYLEALVKIKEIERFRDFVSVSANLKRLAKLAGWTWRHLVAFAKWARTRVVALAWRVGNRIAACGKAIRNLSKSKPSEPTKPETAPAAPAELPPAKVQASPPIQDERKEPTPPTEENPAIDAKP